MHIAQKQLPAVRFMRPPLLAGYSFDPEDAYKARDARQLLTVRVETNRSCNLRCRYCYARGGDHLDHEMPFEKLIDTITQAKQMGAQSIVVIGGGEPTLYPRFMELIDQIHLLGLIPVVFTNGILITRELAEFLYKHNASVMGKLDSMNARVQDFMAGQKGTLNRIQQGLKHLVDVGFTEPDESRRLRLGVSFVSCKLNQQDIERIWHFCRQRNIFPNMEVLTPTGRGQSELPGQELGRIEIQEYKLKVLDIDRTHYGFNWLPFTPLAASGCLQHFYSLYITIEGNARPCAPTKFDEHPALKIDGVYPYNVQRLSLRDIYDSPLFRYVRNIDQYMEGACRHCLHSRECVGCRGYAYSTGVNEGRNPLAALRGECRQCFK